MNKSLNVGCGIFKPLTYVYMYLLCVDGSYTDQTLWMGSSKQPQPIAAATTATKSSGATVTDHPQAEVVTPGVQQHYLVPRSLDSAGRCGDDAVFSECSSTQQFETRAEDTE